LSQLARLAVSVNNAAPASNRSPGGDQDAGHHAVERRKEGLARRRPALGLLEAPDRLRVADGVLGIVEVRACRELLPK
jgi:hypothetical protein